MTDDERSQGDEERELGHLFADLRGLDEPRVPDFARTWATAIRARPKRFVGLALAGVGATALAGATLAVLLFRSAAPAPQVAIDWSARESLRSLLAAPLSLTPESIDVEADPFELRLDAVLQNPRLQNPRLQNIDRGVE